MEALDLFRSGKLQQALDTCVRQVKDKPTDPVPRHLLSQLLCFTGDLERADKQLDTLAMQCPDRARNLTLVRHLIRAATSRREFYESGRLPDFTEPLPDYVKHHLEASICLREGDTGEANRLLEQAEQQRPVVPGSVDGTPFEDMRDGDDLTASFLEVLTSNGKYYWVPLDRMRRLTMEQAAEPIDVLWRATRIEMHSGSQGVVYLPELYIDSATAEDEELRLGQATEWKGGDGAPVRGVGHRLLLFDNDYRPLANIEQIEFVARDDSAGD